MTPGLFFAEWAVRRSRLCRFLHANGICHGGDTTQSSANSLELTNPDFRPANILIKLKSLNHLSENKLLMVLGRPEMAHVLTNSGDLPKSSPEYLTYCADITRIGDAYLTDRICVIDSGESFRISSPPADLGIPENYLPPEVLLGEKNSIGPACDIWALGCTLVEIRQQIPLVYMISDTDELLAEMVRFFGRLPGPWWDTWEARGEFFDEQGTWLRGGDGERWTLEVALSKRVQVVQPRRRALVTPAGERKVMADLLYKLLVYEPEKRPSAEEVLGHEWFKM